VAGLAIVALLVFLAAAVPRAASGALLVLIVFIAAIATAMRRGETPDCHGFAQLHSSPVGWGSLWRNLVFAAVAGLVGVADLSHGARRRSWLRNAAFKVKEGSACARSSASGRGQS
jgi:hypothetical protein